jgi:hypothetical protein
MSRVHYAESNRLACVRNICRSHDSPYLLHRLQIRTQTTMHCEDLLVDDSSDRETIEAICEGFPQFNVISAFACVDEISKVRDKERIKGRLGTDIRHKNHISY